MVEINPQECQGYFTNNRANNKIQYTRTVVTKSKKVRLQT